MSTQTTSNMEHLRQHLLATLADLRDRQNPMEPDRARAVAQIGSVLVDTAKVEIEYLKATGQGRIGFLEEPEQPTVEKLSNTSDSGYTSGTVQRLAGVTRHRMGG